MLWQVGSEAEETVSQADCKTVSLPLRGCGDGVVDSIIAAVVYALVAGAIVWLFKRWLSARRARPRPEADLSPALVLAVRQWTASESYSSLNRLIPQGLSRFDVDLSPTVGYVSRPNAQGVDDEPGAAVDPSQALERADPAHILITGEAGSGKTVILYRMIEALMRDDPTAAPTLVNLSSWTSDYGTIDDYLVSSLTSPTRGAAQLNAVQARSVIRSEAVFFDGLDEVHHRHLDGFVSSLERFVRGRDAPFVLTCREEDFARLPGLLPLSTSLRVRPLESSTVKAVAASVGWRRLARSRRDPPEWTTRPLFLAMAVDAGLDPSDLNGPRKGPPDPALFVAYVRSRLEASDWSPEDGAFDHAMRLRGLSTIARHLTGAELGVPGIAATSDQTIFNIGDLTPRVRPAWAGVAAGSTAALIAGGATAIYTRSPETVGWGWAWTTTAAATLTVAIGLAVGTQIDNASPTWSAVGWWGLLKRRLGWGLLRGAVVGGAAGIAGSLLGSEPGAFAGAGVGALVRLLTRYAYPSSSARRPAIHLVTWATVGALGGAIAGSKSGGFSTAFVLCTVVGAVGTLPRAMIRSATVVGEPRPDDGMRRSLRSWITHTAAYVLGGAIAAGAGLGVAGAIAGAAAGLVGGGLIALDSGGWYVVLQRLARRRLARAQLLPASQNLEPFLEWACRTRILRPVAGGGSVRFVHDLVRDYVATQ